MQSPAEEQPLLSRFQGPLKRKLSSYLLPDKGKEIRWVHQAGGPLVLGCPGVGQLSMLLPQWQPWPEWLLVSVEPAWSHRGFTPTHCGAPARKNLSGCVWAGGQDGARPAAPRKGLTQRHLGRESGAGGSWLGLQPALANSALPFSFTPPPPPVCHIPGF